MVDPAQRIRDPFGFPVWVGANAALTAFCLAVILADRGALLFGVLGYDGLVHWLYERHGSRVPRFGGSLNVTVGVLLSSLTILSCIGYGLLLTRMRRTGAMMLTLPVAMLVLACASLAIALAGGWDAWIAQLNHNVLHFGWPIPKPRYGRVLTLIAGGTILSASIAALMTRSTDPRRTRWRVAAIMLIAALVLAATGLITLDGWDQYQSRRTVVVLSTIVGLWSAGNLLLLSRRRRSEDFEAYGLTRWLLRWSHLKRVLIGVTLLVGTSALLYLVTTTISMLALAGGVIMGLFTYLLAQARELRYFEVTRHVRRYCCARCEYDLRGTVAVERTACPECGEPINDTQYAWLRDNLDEIMPPPQVLMP